MHGDARQGVYRGVDRVASLQHVAQHDRYAEPRPDVRTPAERERHGDACVVDAVEQAPQTVAHAEHAPAPVCRTHHHAVIEPVVPVVVAYQRGTPARDGGLRAARGKAGGFHSAKTAPACSSSTISVSRRHVGTNSGMCSASRSPASPLGSARRRPRGATTRAAPGKTVRSARRACRRARPRPRRPASVRLAPGRPAPVASAPAAEGGPVDAGEFLQPRAPVGPVDAFAQPAPVDALAAAAVARPHGTFLPHPQAGGVRPRDVPLGSQRSRPIGPWSP